MRFQGYYWFGQDQLTIFQFYSNVRQVYGTGYSNWYLTYSFRITCAGFCYSRFSYWLDCGRCVHKFLVICCNLSARVLGGSVLHPEVRCLVLGNGCIDTKPNSSITLLVVAGGAPSLSVTVSSLIMFWLLDSVSKIFSVMFVSGPSFGSSLGINCTSPWLGIGHLIQIHRILYH